MRRKTCPDCLLDLDESAFGCNRAAADGLSHYCLACKRIRSRGGYVRRRQDAGHRYRPRPQHADGQKTCADCGQIKPVREFHRARSQSGGYNCYCKPCRSKRDREQRFLREYGLTPDAYQVLVDRQGGRCAICRERPAEHVDHDHVLGTVRGVLCFPCNAALGQVKDRTDILRNSIDYLETTTWQRTPVCTGVYRLTSPRRAPAASASSSQLQHLISSRRG